MTTWFLAFLVGASLAVCIPAGVKARRRSPLAASQLFKKRLAMVSHRPRGGRWLVVPDSAEAVALRLAHRRAMRRRKLLLASILFLALVSGVVALVAGGPFFWVHVAIDGASLIYIAYLYETARRKDRGAKARSLGPRRGPRAGLYRELHANGGRH